MARYSIRVTWSEQDNLFVATCPALGDLSALGETAPAAVEELGQAIELALETYAARGWPTPEPEALEEYSGQFRLRLPRSLHARLAHEADRQGVSLNGLATSLLAQGMGALDARDSMTNAINAAVGSMKATLLSSMRSTMVEMAADSSTSGKGEVQPPDYVYQGSPPTPTLRLVESAS